MSIHNMSMVFFTLKIPPFISSFQLVGERLNWASTLLSIRDSQSECYLVVTWPFI